MLTFNFSLVLYYLAAFGLAYIAGHSVISEPLRTFVGGTIDRPRPFFGWIVSLVECPACFGTWIGALAGALEPSLFLQGSVLMGAGVGALTTCAINLLLGKRAGLMPSEPDPTRERLAALMEFAARQMLAQPSPAEHRQVLSTMDRDLKFRAGADGFVTFDSKPPNMSEEEYEEILEKALFREEARREMVERGMLPDEMSIGVPIDSDISAEDEARFWDEIEKSGVLRDDMDDLARDRALAEVEKNETEGLA